METASAIERSPLRRPHSDLVLGPGVIGEALAHFHMEAIKAGTAEAWKTAYDETRGIQFLWIVYRSRLDNSETGLFDDLAIGNQVRRLMDGCDEFEHPDEAGRASRIRDEARALLTRLRTEGGV